MANFSRFRFFVLYFLTLKSQIENEIIKIVIIFINGNSPTPILCQ